MCSVGKPGENHRSRQKVAGKPKGFLSRASQWHAYSLVQSDLSFLCSSFLKYEMCQNTMFWSLNRKNLSYMKELGLSPKLIGSLPGDLLILTLCSYPEPGATFLAQKSISRKQHFLRRTSYTYNYYDSIIRTMSLLGGGSMDHINSRTSS